jgi:hypothetical protein
MPRPSLKKTPLAILRSKIKITTDGKKIGTLKELPLSQKDIARWLNCSIFNVQSIESGRVRLTRENAWILMMQTGAHADWLMGKIPGEPINFQGVSYQQKDFDRAQADKSRASTAAGKAQFEFAESVASIATILLRAFKRGEIDFYATKLRYALRQMLSQFPNEKFVDFSNTFDSLKGTSSGHDFSPMVNKWNQEIWAVVGSKNKGR